VCQLDGGFKVAGMVILNAVLTLIAWSLIGVLIVVIYRIARFYQITSGRQTYYRWFLAPLGLLLVAALLNVSADPWLAVWRDVLLLVGGISLIGLGYYLLQLMIGSRP
jgi:tellurite resistance protein TehA-like permease